MRRRERVLAVGVAASAVAAVLSSTPAHATGPTAATMYERQVAAVATPALHWRSCPDSPTRAQCARATVPLDYDRPHGARISLALAKVSATDPAHRIGTIFVNPGGPGGSGVGFVEGLGHQLFTRDVRARFDIVGFDPRGIAGSTPIRCFDTTGEAVRTLAPFPFPYTRAQERVWIAADTAYAQACTRRAGAIIDHMSTADVARDIDLLRRAVGDSRTTFVGYSYGTYIGSTYASMFPHHIRAVVIDGVIDPVSYATGRGDESQTLPIDARLQSEQGAYATLQGFLSLCDRYPTHCAFSAGDPRARYAALANRLLAHPAHLPDGRRITYQDLVSTTLSSMYQATSWPDLARFLEGLDQASGTQAVSALARLQAQGVARPAAGWAYAQVLEGFAGVWCSDGDNPALPRYWASSARTEDRRFPYFGRAWIWGSSICAEWPGQDSDRYTGPFTVPGANGVLVVGNVNDPATRYQDAESTAAMLPGARLLTVNGWGHTSLFISSCADDYTARYLLTGALPPRGAVCQVDHIPFSGRSTSSAPSLWTASQTALLGRPTR